VNRAHTRDEGLARVSSITRWVAALGVAGTAVLAGIVYKAAPGRAASAPATTGGGTVTSGGTGAPAADATAGGGFQAPDQAPVQVQQVPIVRSGAS
jgi:hypothetical protein